MLPTRNNTKKFYYVRLIWLTPIHASKIGGLGHNSGRGGAMLTPTNSLGLLLLGVVTSVPLLAKIDQEMRL